MPSILTRLAAAAALVVTLFACSAREPAPEGKTAPEAVAGVDDEVKAFQLRLLSARLQTIPAGVVHDYVAGILAARSGRSEDAIDLLTHILPELRHSQPQRAAHALEALADAYMMLYRYGDAADAYDDVKDHFAGRLQNDVTDDAALARILAHAPAQTVTWNGLLRLQTSKNAIGSLVSTLEAKGVRAEWLLDTGANQSVVSRSFAARLGLATLAGSASTGSGITGWKSTLQAAILPELRLGGATIRNTPVIVLDDDNLRVGSPRQPYQIHAVLGFPALKALGRISFTHDGLLLAADPKDTAAGVPMFMRGLTPAIECDVQGEHLLFTFDTGASSTDFSVRYYEQFRGQAAAWQTRTVESSGAGGSVQRTMFIQPSVNLRVGNAVVTLKDVSIFPTRMNAGMDVLFGNLGQDFVADVERFTLDFVNMRFSLGAPVSAPAGTIH